MRIPLAVMAARSGHKKPLTTFAPILTTQVQANDLAAIYRRMLSPWFAAQPVILERYTRELALTTDSIDDIASLFQSLADDVSRLVLELTPALRQWAFRTEAYHRGKWQRTVLAGSGVDISAMIGPNDAQETVAAFLARNTELIRDISSQARGRIADAVLRGYQQRVPAREVGKQITEATGMARTRARRVAADQNVKLASALDAQRQRQAGLDIYRYRHSGKLHPRSWHKARDNKLYERDTGKQVLFENGQMTYGSDIIDPDDRAGVPPYCACTTEGVLILDGEVL